VLAHRPSSPILKPRKRPFCASRNSIQYDKTNTINFVGHALRQNLPLAVNIILSWTSECSLLYGCRQIIKRALCAERSTLDQPMPNLTSAAFPLGAVIGVTLLALLVLTRLIPSLRIWPPPAAKTWQSYVFWPLFRSLNILCFIMAALGGVAFLGLPLWMRALAAIVCAGSIAVFIYAFRVLGRDNSYGAQDGLVTSGIYQWSRNPQNAMLMLVYASLALATDNAPTMALCAAMLAVYFIMILTEEPWLKDTYGPVYADYCADVPRLFNWRKAFSARRG
jgi:protein-S-isoprenylcysteine O-methyltransferase Ste14